MTKTADCEKLQYFTNDKSGVKEVTDRYYHYVINLQSYGIIEASDEEVLTLPEKLGIFSFLNNPGEDIYSNSDGSPLL